MSDTSILVILSVVLSITVKSNILIERNILKGVYLISMIKRKHDIKIDLTIPQF